MGRAQANSSYFTWGCKPLFLHCSRSLTFSLCLYVCMSVFQFSPVSVNRSLGLSILACLFLFFVSLRVRLRVASCPRLHSSVCPRVLVLTLFISSSCSCNLVFWSLSSFFYSCPRVVLSSSSSSCSRGLVSSSSSPAAELNTTNTIQQKRNSLFRPLCQGATPPPRALVHPRSNTHVSQSPLPLLPPTSLHDPCTLPRPSLSLPYPTQRSQEGE